MLWSSLKWEAISPFDLFTLLVGRCLAVQRFWCGREDMYRCILATSLDRSHETDACSCWSPRNWPCLPRWNRLDKWRTPSLLALAQSFFSWGSFLCSGCRDIAVWRWAFLWWGGRGLRTEGQLVSTCRGGSRHQVGDWGSYKVYSGYTMGVDRTRRTSDEHI